jgi:hypothetical protein
MDLGSMLAFVADISRYKSEFDAHVGGHLHVRRWKIINSLCCEVAALRRYSHVTEVA